MILAFTGLVFTLCEVRVMLTLVEVAKMISFVMKGPNKLNAVCTYFLKSCPKYWNYTSFSWCSVVNVIVVLSVKVRK